MGKTLKHGIPENEFRKRETKRSKKPLKSIQKNG